MGEIGIKTIANAIVRVNGSVIVGHRVILAVMLRRHINHYHILYSYENIFRVLRIFIFIPLFSPCVLIYYSLLR